MRGPPGGGGAHKMPALVDNGPGWVVAALVILQQDGQQGDARQEAAAAELQDASPVPARPLRRHHQDGKPTVFCPALRRLNIVIYLTTVQGASPSAETEALVCTRSQSVIPILSACLHKVVLAMEGRSWVQPQILLGHVAQKTLPFL